MKVIEKQVPHRRFATVRNDNVAGKNVVVGKIWPRAKSQEPKAKHPGA
jgi:hypothetical protein